MGVFVYCGCIFCNATLKLKEPQASMFYVENAFCESDNKIRLNASMSLRQDLPVQRHTSAFNAGSILCENRSERQQTLPYNPVNVLA